MGAEFGAVAKAEKTERVEPFKRCVRSLDCRDETEKPLMNPESTPRVLSNLDGRCRRHDHGGRRRAQTQVLQDPCEHVAHKTHLDPECTVFDTGGGGMVLRPGRRTAFPR